MPCSTPSRTRCVEVVAASADLLPVLVVGAPLRHLHRIYNTAVVIHRGAVLGVVPKSYLPTYREFYERRQIAPGDGERGTIRIGGARRAVRPRPAVRRVGRARISCCTSRSARTCSCRCRPAPRPHWPARPCWRNLSGSPITIGRAEDRSLLARSASARCLAAYVYAAAGEGESTTDLAWDGQTMIWENGVAARRIRALPQGRAPLGRRRRHRAAAIRAAADGHLRRQPAPPPGVCGVVPPHRIPRSTHPPATSDCCARSNDSRSCRRIAQRLEQDCYEAYNIQVAGLEQRLRALNYPKVVIGVSGGLDSTHALIVAATRDGPGSRPRSDILAFTLPGLRHRRAHQEQRDQAGARRWVSPSRKSTSATTAKLMLERDRSSVRARREGLRRHLRERAGRPAHRLPVPARQPARRHRAWHR